MKMEMVYRQNYLEAAKWYQMAAEQGDLYAQINLGSMYSAGRGVPQDYKEAIKWFRAAARKRFGGSTI